MSSPNILPANSFPSAVSSVAIGVDTALSAFQILETALVGEDDASVSELPQSFENHKASLMSTGSSIIRILNRCYEFGTGVLGIGESFKTKALDERLEILSGFRNSSSQILEMSETLAGKTMELCRDFDRDSAGYDVSLLQRQAQRARVITTPGLYGRPDERQELPRSDRGGLSFNMQESHRAGPGYSLLNDVLKGRAPRGPAQTAPEVALPKGAQAIQDIISALSGIHSSLSTICQFWQEMSEACQRSVDRASIDSWVDRSTSEAWMYHQEVLAEAIRTISRFDLPTSRADHNDTSSRTPRSSYYPADRMSRWSIANYDESPSKSTSSISALLYIVVGSIVLVTFATRYLGRQSVIIDYDHRFT